MAAVTPTRRRWNGRPAKRSRSAPTVETPRNATVSELKAAHRERLQGYSDTFLMCRDLRHAWDPPSALWREGRRVCRRIECGRCGTQRIDRWTPSGLREQPSYIYPDNYRMQGDVYPTNEIRLEVMSRLSIFDSEDTMIESAFGNTRKRKASA